MTEVERPKCETPWCHNLAKRQGTKGYKKLCSSCHRKKYGMVSKDKRYKLFKKDYCENIDGRLGFECTTTIEHPCMLTVDHKDGNRKNNDPDNLMTLCACCHNYKSVVFRDTTNGNFKNKAILPL